MVDNCNQLFGEGWVQTRLDQPATRKVSKKNMANGIPTSTQTATTQASQPTGHRLMAKLKTFDEIAPRLDEPGKFLLIEGEELTDNAQKLPVHLNIINTRELFLPRNTNVFVAPGKKVKGQPLGPDNVADLINFHLEQVHSRQEALNTPIPVTIDHPNFCYAYTAEDLAAAKLGKYVEVYNGSPIVNNEGDQFHQTVERQWDISSALRVRSGLAPLMCLASDDAHNYFEFGALKTNPGRGWIMVRAAELTTPSLINAMENGDFYASTGVTLRDIKYDRDKGAFTVDVEPDEGVEYTIRFIGTLQNADMVSSRPVVAKPKDHISNIYSQDIGKELLIVKGTSATYTLKGDELYVRAEVVSSDLLPIEGSQVHEKAWCQPFGFEKRLSVNAASQHAN
jgi:hypothetical protein